MTRIAICLHGGVGQLQKRTDSMDEAEYIDPELCYNQYKYFGIIDDNVDIFFHTWNNPYENKLVELYQPKGYEIEPSKDFDHDTSGHKIYGTWCRFYSMHRANKLKKQYEEQHGFKYDYVMQTRFDLAFLTGINFKEYDPNNFYVQHSDWLKKRNSKAGLWNRWHVADWWFFSNSKNMDHFSDLYLNLEEYLKLGKLPATYKQDCERLPKSPQHLVARRHIQNSFYKNNVKYILFRDDDHCLIRDILNNKPSYRRSDIWYFDDGVYKLKPVLHKQLKYKIFEELYYV